MHSQINRATGTWFQRAVIAAVVGALLALLLAVAPPGMGGLGAERAEASSCKGADRGPRKITRPQARKAVVCVINQKRQAQGVGQAAPEGGRPSLAHDDGEQLLRPSVRRGGSACDPRARHQLPALRLLVGAGRELGVGQEVTRLAGSDRGCLDEQPAASLDAVELCLRPHRHRRRLGQSVEDGHAGRHLHRRLRLQALARRVGRAIQPAPAVPLYEQMFAYG
jgi:hypothetical protein